MRKAVKPVARRFGRICNKNPKRLREFVTVPKKSFFKDHENMTR